MMFMFFKRKLHRRILILSSLPLEYDEAYTLYQNNKSDFIASIGEICHATDFDTIWSAYQSSTTQLKKIYADFEAAGATVLRSFNIDDLNRITKYDAVILVVHHIRDCDAVEIGGMAVPTKKIVNSIPEDFSGVLDISSCYSSSFQLDVKMRAPQCRTIATETETSLRVRIVIYGLLLERIKQVNENYVDSFRFVIESLISSTHKSYALFACSCERSETNDEVNKEDTPNIHLGGVHRSTVYAPAKVKRGDTFLVQIFLHGGDDGGEIEIQARMVDDTTEKRNSKPISFKLKNNDKIDISFHSNNNSSEDFQIFPSRQSVVWRGEPISVEFSVSVEVNTSYSAFIGTIILSVNKIPAGTMMFRTTLVSDDNREMSECATFVVTPYDKNAEMQSVHTMLSERIYQRINILSQQNASDEHIRIEKDMCERCLQLLSEKKIRLFNAIPRVFISSTSDMAPYRKVIEERVKACEMFPDMYELWGQENDYPRDMCCKHVLQSDFFVCILGSTYGFIEPIWNKSMTEIEYRVAQSAGIPILVYILNNAEKPIDSRQNEFLNEVKSERLVGLFSDEMTLALMANSELLTLKITADEKYKTHC